MHLIYYKQQMSIKNPGDVTFCPFCCELLIELCEYRQTTLTLSFDIPLTFLCNRQVVTRPEINIQVNK